MIHKYSEEELVLSIKQNSRAGFNYLYANYSVALLVVIRGIIKDEQTTEDILQDTFVSIWLHIHQYDRTKGHFYTWIRNIAKNKAIDSLRSGINNMKSRTDPNEHKIHAASCNTEQKTDHIGMSKIIMALAPKHRSLIYLVYYKGHTLEETSSIQQIPLGTTKTRMNRALRLLRAYFNVAL